MSDEAALQAIMRATSRGSASDSTAASTPVAKDRHRGYTLLHVAAQQGELGAGKALLAGGADATLTKGERRLVAKGRDVRVLDYRAEFQEATREDATPASRSSPAAM